MRKPIDFRLSKYRWVITSTCRTEKKVTVPSASLRELLQQLVLPLHTPIVFLGKVSPQDGRRANQTRSGKKVKAKIRNHLTMTGKDVPLVEVRIWPSLAWKF